MLGSQERIIKFPRKSISQMAVVEMWFARWPWVWFPACSPHLLQGWSQLFFAQTGLPSLIEEPSLSKQAKESLEDAQPTMQAPENVSGSHKHNAGFPGLLPSLLRKGRQLPFSPVDSASTA